MSLKDKLKERKSKLDDDNFDWGAVRQKFENVYADLLNEIRGWFAEYIQDGVAEIYDLPVTVNEEQNGEYTIPSIKIAVNDEIVVFLPVGAEILGAGGRFDFYIVGHKDKAKRVLLGRNKADTADAWIIWEPNGPYHKKEFTKDNLEEIIEGWI